MSWELKIDPTARKYLLRIPTKDASRLLVVLEEFRKNPFTGDLEKMKGEENVWRKRVGNYRIFFEIYMKRRVIYISDIKRRTSNTY